MLQLDHVVECEVVVGLLRRLICNGGRYVCHDKFRFGNRERVSELSLRPGEGCAVCFITAQHVVL